MQNRCLYCSIHIFYFRCVSVSCKSHRVLQAEEVKFFPFKELLLVGRTPCLISFEDLRLQLTWAIMKLLGEPIELTLVKTPCSFTGKNLLKIA